MRVESDSYESEILIIGAGAIGLACAWRLAQAGARVTLLDRVQTGREASFAAGGMLAPISESLLHPWCGDNEKRSAMLDLCVGSLELYPKFVAELESLAGRDVELSLGTSGSPDWRAPGILVVPEADQTLPREHGQPRYHNGLPSLWLQNEGQVDNRKLVDALRKVCLNSGVWIRENSLVRGFEVEKHRITHIYTPSGKLPVSTVLICAGAWSSKFKGLPEEAMLPVRPVAGSMVQLRSDHRLKHVIYSKGCYLVPRRDGRLLVGATTEDIGYAKRVTVDGIWQLLSAARELEPSLADAPFESHWAGLRPTTPDDLPIVGSGPLENLFYATGHGRNGILLTPKTAEIVTDMVLKGHEAPQFWV